MNKFKQIAAAIFSAIIITTSIACVYAEPEATQQPKTESKSVDDEYQENPNLTVPDTSHAEAVLLMDMKTGRIIYSKNITKKLYPASLTKMMTAILALESDKMGDTVEIPYEAIKSVDILEESNIGLLVGEKLTMTDLLNSMLIASANDSSNVIAYHVAGSMEEFTDMMNSKAKELGMKNTNFVNACGIHNDDHYTTVEDMAILARYCMENESFREIVKKATYHIAPTEKYKYDRNLNNTNMFLGQAFSPTHVYSPCTGIKTGTTEAAGNCLVSSASHNDMDLLCVVMKAKNENDREKAYSYTISRALFDFGFNNYESGVLAAPGTIVSDSAVDLAKKDKRVSLTVNSEINALVPIGDDISKEVTTEITLQKNITAPIAKGQELGEIVYIYHDKEIARAPIVATNDVERDIIKFIFRTVVNLITNPLVFIPAILIIIAIFIAVSTSRAKKRRMERRRKLQQIRQRHAANEDNSDTYAQNRMMRNRELNHSRSKGANSRYSSDRTDK